MFVPIKTTNNLNQQPSLGERAHLNLVFVLMTQAGHVAHPQPASSKQMNTCVELKKQGKEKKPDANLVGTPFPKP